MLPEAALLLGEALHELGSFEAAETVLATAEAEVGPDDPLFALIVQMRARTLMWGLHRRDDALAMIRSAREGASGVVADELALCEAILLTYSGRPLDALALVDSVAERDDPRVRTLRALAEIPALIVTGKPETGARLARAAFAAHQELPQQVATDQRGGALQPRDPRAHRQRRAARGHVARHFCVSGAAGELAAGRADVAHPPHRPVRAPDRPGRDRPPVAGRDGGALGRARHRGPPPIRAVAARDRARAGWATPRPPANAVAELERLPVLPHARADQALGPAWARVAAGDVPGGRDLLFEAADVAAGTGHRVSEAWILHDVARLGDPARVVDRLEWLAGECEGPLVEVYALHARAGTGVRPEPFVEAADRFEEIGALLLAAEAATEAAQAFQRRGDGRAASALSARSARLANACEGARTPALATTAAVVPLSARERDVAEAGRAGGDRPRRSRPGSSCRPGRSTTTCRTSTRSSASRAGASSPTRSATTTHSTPEADGGTLSP